MKFQKITLTDRGQLDEIMRTLRTAVEIGPHEIIIRKRVQSRTLSQNSALHAYTSIMAEKMNDAGVTQRSLVGSFKEGFELPVTNHMIKDIFREVGRVMFRRESTAELTTIEIQKVYEVVDQRFAEVTGVSAAWPSLEPPVYE